MIKKFLNNKTVRLIALIVGVLLIASALIGTISLITKQLEKKTKRVLPTYVVGTLNSNGVYVEDNQSIFTKNLIECVGLKTTLQFNNNVKYKIYFYDENEIFLSDSGVLNENSTYRPEVAKYCRIVITPKEDNKVSWWEILKYSKQVKVEVDKVQKYNNLYKVNSVDHRQDSTNINNVTSINGTGWSVSSVIDVGSYETIRIYTKADTNLLVYLATNNGNISSVYAPSSSANISAMTSVGTYAGYTMYEITSLSTIKLMSVESQDTDIFVFGR